jgi:AraC-like DNA-binding protein
MDQYIVSEVLHYCNITVPRSTEMKKREINYYDLTFVLSGRLLYRADGQMCEIKKNDAVFLRPGCQRERFALEEKVSYVSFNFTTLENVDFPFDSFMKKCVNSDIRKLISAFPQSHILPYYNSREKLCNMLNFILLEFLSSHGNNTVNEHVVDCMKYIDEHINEKMSLSTLAQYANISREYLSGIFRRETGKTVTEYINERKMQAAKELISVEKMSLSDVSEHLGYDNYNYFSRLFRRHFDISPVEMRKKI